MYILIHRPDSVLGHSGSPLRDHACVTRAMSYTRHLQSFLKLQAQRFSQRGCAPFSLSAVLVPAGHLASCLGFVARAGISSRAGAGLAAGPGWQKSHLHSSTSSLCLSCAFCTDSRLLLTDNLWREDCAG